MITFTKLQLNFILTAINLKEAVWIFEESDEEFKKAHGFDKSQAYDELNKLYNILKHNNK